ncbi:hypothetical protein KOR34_04920 [Posidoniimonas corsicana]|uniref:ScoMcrA-like N-terminal head domain-containing protein n=1 Tax=Posidoniimonas corsicana TaxID=1938618 RepID=A0A5C5VCM6_9BACT|nr:hypothetical protein [Posidoniimonas corsicana]TWT35599.1 hypothetical protein KOR34_04920 [Posidoniimonas corsicana]
MTARVPARVLYKISKQHLVQAIERSKQGESLPRFADSTRFDLLHDGLRFPPKVVIALAAEAALGAPLGPDDFSGGESSTAFRILLDNGFEIVTKMTTVAGLDATFSVGRNAESTFLIIESKGPDRNIDYLAGLETLLHGLAECGASLSCTLVDSASSRNLARAESQINIDDYSYPIELRQVTDINDLRRSITRSAARTARTLESTSGGNPTKRLRLVIGIEADASLHGLQHALAQGSAMFSNGPGEFRFCPSSPTQSVAPSQRRGIEPGTVSHVHAAMQRSLYAKLVDRYGRPSVAVECQMASGNLADLVVKVERGLEIFEIKTSLSPRECIRQAIGQLLEYAHWPISCPISALHVVGPREADAIADAYLSTLREIYRLPLFYIFEPEPNETSIRDSMTAWPAGGR